MQVRDFYSETDIVPEGARGGRGGGGWSCDNLGFIQTLVQGLGGVLRREMSSPR